MPWFYAGPEAKPVGPVSLEELHARRLNGSLTGDTYVIEQVPGVPSAWKRYGELFPALPPRAAFELPPVPPVPPVAIAPVPHPLFPSATFAPAPSPTYSSVQLRPSTVPIHYDHLSPTPKANPWCAWGFGLGIASLFGILLCGLGVLVAPFGLVVSILGLTKVNRHAGETGRGMAVTGLVLSCLTLLFALSLFLSWAIPAFQAHERTVTEQTSNDSE